MSGKGTSPGTIELPVIAPAERMPRGTAMGRRRAVALVIVHLIVLGHLAHWWATGSTLTPLEPSEAGHSIRDGAVNAGAIFLVVMLLSTLVLGRFFCGWACHLVAYQDLARWLLLRMRISPRPVRSRLLLFVPLFAAYWLYGKPLVDRWLAGDPRPALSWHLTTADFWATFPGWAIGIATFAVCGFLIIYVLGAKGFCTYGCPYGGLFVLADRLAPGRIRVTDACDGSADCTTNCSSNVDVAREVALYGMVVDPGCMKCMDCVAGCPNDALHFGFAPRASRARRRFRRMSWLWAPPTLLALALAGMWAVLFHVGWVAGLSIAVGLALASAAWAMLGAAPSIATSAERPYDFTIAEEIFLAAAFTACFAVLFDLYNIVPLLLAIGVSVMLAYGLLLVLRLRTCASLAIQNVALKADRRLSVAGIILAAAMLVSVPALVHAGMIQWHGRRLGALAAQAEVDRALGDRDAWERAADAMTAHAAFLDRWGWAPTRGLDRIRGEVSRWGGRPDEALRWYRSALEAGSRNRELPMLIALALLERGDQADGEARLRSAIIEQEAPLHRMSKATRELGRLGQLGLQIEVLDAALRRAPAEGDIALQLCTLLVRAPDPAMRDPARAIAVAEACCAANDRGHAELLGLLAWLYDQSGRPAEALGAAESSRDAARRSGRDRLAAEMQAAADVYRSRIETDRR